MMNSYHSAVKQYFVNYLHRLKSDILPQQYAETLNVQNNIKQFVTNYTRNNPTKTAIINGIIPYQSGGLQLDKTDFTAKIGKITALFEEFKNITKKRDIEQDFTELTKNINDIIQQINDDSIRPVPSSDRVANDIKILRDDIKKFIAGDKVGTPISLKLPYVDIYDNTPFESTFKVVFDQLKQDVKDLETKVPTTDDENKQYADAIPILDVKLNDVRDNYRKELDKIKAINKVLKAENDAWEEYLKCKSDFTDTELVFVKEIYQYVNEIISIMNAFPPSTDDEAGEGSSTDSPKEKQEQDRIKSICYKYISERTSIFAESAVSESKKNEKLVKNDNEFISKYNDMITYNDATKYKIPIKIYDDNDVITINNNIFMHKQSQFKTIYSDTISQIEELNNTMITKISDDTLLNIMDRIINPKFVSNTGHHVGGGDVSSELSDLMLKISSINDMQIQYFKELYDYKKLVKEYNVKQQHMIMHTLFYVLIVTNQLYTGTYVIYEYIGKGLIAFYNRIIGTIIEKINLRDPTPEVDIFRRYHWVTLNILYNFFNAIENSMTSRQIIDINNCADTTVKSCFLLFNYIKGLLDEFNSRSLSKLSIYARINDFKENNTDPFDFNKKIFISDFERRNVIKSDLAMAKRIIEENILDDDDFILPIDVTQQELFEEKRLNPDIDEERMKSLLESNRVDLGLMYIRTSNDQLCNGFYNPSNKNNMVRGIQALRFTEVFDSVEHPENKHISKYMSMATQLSQGKGVALLTYGYSGTGKTYTLFGKSETGVKGLLQSTLTTITNLDSIDFRIYEIYGHGVPYPHYWSDEKSGASRVNDISHQLFTYDLILTKSELNFNNINIVTADDIAKFVEADSGAPDGKYLKIEATTISSVFKSFDIFIDKVEKCRQDDPVYNRQNDNISPELRRRVRGTPNNPVSSRSVLIFDFKLTIIGNAKPVQFLIVDLPGREEIIQTYVDPYFNNTAMEHILKESIKYKLTSTSVSTPATSTELISKINSWYAQIKLLAASIALNPMRIAVADAFGVVSEFNKKKNSIKNGIISANAGSFFEQKVNKDNNTLSTFYAFEDFKIVLKKRKPQGGDRTKLIKYEKSAEDNKQVLYGILAIHLINHLLQLKKFDILHDINKNLLHNHLNSLLENYVDTLSPSDIEKIFIDLVANSFKATEIADIKKSNYNKETLKKIILYDYYLTGLEGIYINENIIGLIKYLGTDPKINQDAGKKKPEIKKQDSKLKFDYQQKYARGLLLYKDNISEKSTTETRNKQINKVLDWKTEDGPIPLSVMMDNNEYKPTNMKYDFNNVNEEIDRMKMSYKSHCIFNENEPLIKAILQPYLNNIEEYKVFYLFANYEVDDKRHQKCIHQYNLLANTKNFITSLVKND